MGIKFIHSGRPLLLFGDAKSNKLPEYYSDTLILKKIKLDIISVQNCVEDKVYLDYRSFALLHQFKRIDL